ncbi:AbfB domain-containing protein [Actinosynnema sp. CA-248983]
MDGDVRELADSQFRVVDGFLGAGTVALQSVNFPDRYARADGTDLRIGPYEDTDAYGRAASFVLEEGRSGLSLRQGDLHVTHDTGRLVMARVGTSREARERATFRVG